MNKIYVFDVASILANPHLLSNYKDEEIIILDDVKSIFNDGHFKSEEVRKRARTFNNVLNELSDEDRKRIKVVNLESSPAKFEDRFIKACKQIKEKTIKNVIVVSNDSLLRVLLDAKGIVAEDIYSKVAQKTGMFLKGIASEDSYAKVIEKTELLLKEELEGINDEELIKVGFIGHSWKESMDLEILNKRLKGINEAAQLADIDTYCDEVGYIIYDTKSNIFVKLSHKEKKNLWKVWRELRWGGDAEGLPRDIINSIDNGIIHVTEERFKKLIAEMEA